MLTFEQARALKEGDVIYHAGYTGYVIRVDLNEKDQSALIVYTDGSVGGDKFESQSDDPRISIKR